jgi:hypothetical protein
MPVAVPMAVTMPVAFAPVLMAFSAPIASEHLILPHYWVKDITYDIS